MHIPNHFPQDFKKRCFGSGTGKEFYAHYHDNEWGVPSHEDQHLFEMLILEGAQAGLSWPYWNEEPISRHFGLICLMSELVWGVHRLY